MSSTPASTERLVGDKAHGLAFQTAKADHDILRVIGRDLEEIALIGHRFRSIP
jgi:hypothetical protein